MSNAEGTTSRENRNKDGVPMHSFVVRIPQEMNEKLEARAREETTSKVAVVRAMLRRYLK
jgi:hypothetical protein